MDQKNANSNLFQPDPNSWNNQTQDYFQATGYNQVLLQQQALLIQQQQHQQQQHAQLQQQAQLNQHVQQQQQQAAQQQQRQAVQIQQQQQQAVQIHQHAQLQQQQQQQAQLQQQQQQAAQLQQQHAQLQQQQQQAAQLQQQAAQQQQQQADQLQQQQLVAKLQQQHAQLEQQQQQQAQFQEQQQQAAQLQQQHVQLQQQQQQADQQQQQMQAQLQQQALQNLYRASQNGISINQVQNPYPNLAAVSTEGINNAANSSTLTPTSKPGLVIKLKRSQSGEFGVVDNKGFKSQSLMKEVWSTGRPQITKQESVIKVHKNHSVENVKQEQTITKEEPWMFNKTKDNPLEALKQLHSFASKNKLISQEVSLMYKQEHSLSKGEPMKNDPYDFKHETLTNGHNHLDNTNGHSNGLYSSDQSNDSAKLYHRNIQSTTQSYNGITPTLSYNALLQPFLNGSTRVQSNNGNTTVQSYNGNFPVQPNYGNTTVQSHHGSTPVQANSGNMALPTFPSQAIMQQINPSPSLAHSYIDQFSSGNFFEQKCFDNSAIIGPSQVNKKAPRKIAPSTENKPVKTVSPKKVAKEKSPKKIAIEKSPKKAVASPVKRKIVDKDFEPSTPSPKRRRAKKIKKFDENGFLIEDEDAKKGNPRKIELYKPVLEGKMDKFSKGAPKSILDLEATRNYFTKEEIITLKQRAEGLNDVFPSCGCVEGSEDGPYYCQLGYAQDFNQLKLQSVQRFGCSENEIRFIKVTSAKYEGMSKEQCPVAKWVITRSPSNEKFLVVYKSRPGHTCPYTLTVASILMYEAIPLQMANNSYKAMRTVTVQQLGDETSRKCGANAEKSCRCQGLTAKCGLSYTFGCSTSIYMHKYCKFGKGNKDLIRKFNLGKANVTDQETNLESSMSLLGDTTGDLHSKLAPDCFNNMALFDQTGCRIGNSKEKPYSGVTCVVDFCAHAHKDDNNMVGGCTAIITLTKDAWKTDPELRQIKEQERIKQQELEKVKQEQMNALNPADFTNSQLSAMTLTNGNHLNGIAPINGNNLNGNASTNDMIVDESIDSEQYHVLPMYRPCATEQQIDSMVIQGSLERTRLTPDDVPDKFPDYLQGMGGVGFSLPHGSMLLEVAKHELHATTPVQNPNRTEPTRIGLVYYQHLGLHQPDHAIRAVYDQDCMKEHFKYLSWLNQEFIPSGGEIKTMKSSGYIFPEGVLYKEDKNRKGDDHLKFDHSQFPDFQPAKMLGQEGRPDLSYTIHPIRDKEYPAFRNGVNKFIQDNTQSKQHEDNKQHLQQYENKHHEQQQQYEQQQHLERHQKQEQQCIQSSSQQQPLPSTSEALAVSAAQQTPHQNHQLQRNLGHHLIHHLKRGLGQNHDHQSQGDLGHHMNHQSQEDHLQGLKQHVYDHQSQEDLGHHMNHQSQEDHLQGLRQHVYDPPNEEDSQQRVIQPQASIYDFE